MALFTAPRKLTSADSCNRTTPARCLKQTTKLISRNVKFITSINNASLFLDSTQSNLNFEPSFVGIHHALRETWLFEYECQATNFGQL